jgi:DNA-binding PadR family transcriptional regulator
MFHDRTFREDRIWRRARRENPFQKGDLKYILLDMIKDKPRHGYEIIREIENQSSGFYKPSPGVIYPTLQMLEEMGYTKSSEEEGKKTYAITEEGLNFLVKKKDIANGIRSEIKQHWKFKNIGKVAVIMGRFHDFKELIRENVHRLDAEKTERILVILSRGYQEIESIINE